VWKERIKSYGTDFRLGGLYCIGPFEFTEREMNYEEYGENKYEP
jgi:hypothetical protein